MNIEIGDKLKCVFNQPLPGNDHAPALILGEEYTCKGFHLEGDGQGGTVLHISVGLPLTLNFVRSYATGKELPPTTHWCHPNRFVIVK